MGTNKRQGALGTRLIEHGMPMFFKGKMKRFSFEAGRIKRCP